MFFINTLIICISTLAGLFFVGYLIREIIFKYFDLYAPAKIDLTKEMKADIDEIRTKLSGIELQRGINVRRQ